MSKTNRIARHGHGGTVDRSCGKWRYRLRQHAEETRQAINHRTGEQLKVYGCTLCGGFHLTSQR